MSYALIPTSAIAWQSSGDTGVSSKAIWTHMAGGSGDSRGYSGHPHDPDDFGRCVRLLKAVPEWAPRISEMAAYSEPWANLCARWDDVYKSMEDEVGIDWSKGRHAPKTYALMRTILYGSADA